MSFGAVFLLFQSLALASLGVCHLPVFKVSMGGVFVSVRVINGCVPGKKKL
jgi:hypothetical protein